MKTRTVIAGCYLRDYRLRLRLSIRALSRECGLSHMGYHDLERGYSWPLPETAKRVIVAMSKLTGQKVHETQIWPALAAHYDSVGGVK